MEINIKMEHESCLEILAGDLGQEDISGQYRKSFEEQLEKKHIKKQAALHTPTVGKTA